MQVLSLGHPEVTASTLEKFYAFGLERESLSILMNSLNRSGKKKKKINLIELFCEIQYRKTLEQAGIPR